MKICTACGLPAPPATVVCALCSHSFSVQRPAFYGLERHRGGYRWVLDGDEVVTAACRDGSWDLADTATGRVAVTLIGARREDRAHVAMVNHRLRSAATFAPAEPDASSGTGLVRDSFGEVVMALRGDGPTGIHLVDPNGRVLALVSRRSLARSGLDLLVTRAGGCASEAAILGVSLALQLLATGELAG